MVNGIDIDNFSSLIYFGQKRRPIKEALNFMVKAFCQNILGIYAFLHFGTT